MAARALDPIQIPPEFWDRADTRSALCARDVGLLFRLVSRGAGASQTRIGVATGIPAHLMNGFLDGVVEEVTPVLTLPPELRVATVTAYTARLGRSLARKQFRGSKAVLEIRRGLRDFNARALSAGWDSEAG